MPPEPTMKRPDRAEARLIALVFAALAAQFALVILWIRSLL